ncbi:hypothetical protein HJ590_13185 [Naumannella sp. ID2617S]|nr:hypothetical protein [Naumannella sp. ID2617S]
MKVKILASVVTAGGHDTPALSLAPGAEVELPKKVADNLIKGGLAEAITTAQSRTTKPKAPTRETK